MSIPTWLVDVLGTIYVLSGLTAAGILAPWGLRGVRAWLAAHRPYTVIGWIFWPFWILVMIGLGLMALYFLMTMWPIVAIVVVQRRRRERAIHRELDAEEEGELLQEVRRERAARERAP